MCGRSVTGYACSHQFSLPDDPAISHRRDSHARSRQCALPGYRRAWEDSKEPWAAPEIDPELHRSDACEMPRSYSAFQSRRCEVLIREANVKRLRHSNSSEALRTGPEIERADGYRCRHFNFMLDSGGDP